MRIRKPANENTNQMKKIISILKLFFIVISGAFILHSCAGPKAYQKIYLNDAEMELSSKKAEKFEMNFQVYREGASGYRLLQPYRRAAFCYYHPGA